MPTTKAATTARPSTVPPITPFHEAPRAGRGESRTVDRGVITVATTGATELYTLCVGAGGGGVERLTVLTALGSTMASGGGGAGSGVATVPSGWAIFRSTRRRAG